MKILRSIRREYARNGKRILVKEYTNLKRKYGFFRCRCPRGSSWKARMCTALREPIRYFSARSVGNVEELAIHIGYRLNMVRRRRPRLQRMYGVFKCRCHKTATWSSAHVYCVRGTFKVYYKQECARCGNALNPSYVNYRKCALCDELMPDCQCHRNPYYDGGHTGPAHRSDLCLKCKAGDPCTQQRG